MAASTSPSRAVLVLPNSLSWRMEALAWAIRAQHPLWGLVASFQSLSRHDSPQYTVAQEAQRSWALDFSHWVHRMPEWSAASYLATNAEMAASSGRSALPPRRKTYTPSCATRACSARARSSLSRLASAPEKLRGRGGPNALTAGQGAFVHEHGQAQEDVAQVGRPQGGEARGAQQALPHLPQQPRAGLAHVPVQGGSLHPQELPQPYVPRGAGVNGPREELQQAVQLVVPGPKARPLK